MGENFQNVISKAKTACEVSGQEIPDHFADVGKTIKMPKSAEKIITDLMLTRYACYLIAQNGDPRKQEIAFAQTYFAVKTEKQKLLKRKCLSMKEFRQERNCQRRKKSCQKLFLNKQAVMRILL